ncbi:hypothetical protein [Caldicellulosiruptor morganii]|uniref:TadE family protein n=1 Tax=Caldicellulosiruptor morganii TaxID=1387555 RepID=A0ABY7BPI1_9FIRM|nr:hypothetical protein [Caldicellulosiruptor morganii]WAM33309.1 hypothetical protein OTK00_001804 [Caldicellulosiruptor morganii]
MRFFKKLLKLEGGSSSVAGFLLVLPLALVLTINPLYMLFDTLKYTQLDSIARKYIIKMEVEGGLTTTDYADLIQKVAELGCSNIQVSYTPYPVDFGDTVRLKIVADMKFRRISFFGGLKNETKQVCVGPYESISKQNPIVQ